MGNEMLSAALDNAKINELLTQYWRVSVVDVTASTQSDLAQLVREGKAAAGDVITAEFQSAGRGRMSRSFEAPKATALLFSFFVQPKRNREDWGWIALIAGATVASALADYKAQVKWPNDILINEKKVSGLIAEIVGDGIVLGIGINTGMNEAQLPVPTATSLALQGAIGFDRNDLLCKVLRQFEDYFVDWDNGSDAIVTVYKNLSSTLGSEVEVHFPDNRVEKAVAVDISARGELVLDSGTHVQAGDVVHLR